MPSDPGAVSALRRTDFYAAIRANRRRTFLLCAVMIAIGCIVGYAIGWAFELIAKASDLGAGSLTLYSQWGLAGALFLFVFSLAWTAIAVLYGDRLVVRMVGAERASSDAEPVLHNVVEEMAIAAGLPTPEIVIIETPALNAFATGMKPEKATIGVTRGLLYTMNRDELQGVIAHEMGHIANADTLYMTAVGVIVGVIAFVSYAAFRTLRYGAFARHGRGRGGAAIIVAVIVLGLVALIAPLAAKAVQMAVSREREYLADATSVKLTRHPRGLISALRKIEASTVSFDGTNPATQHIFISNPVKRFDERSRALFATHPATSLRIDRLQNLG